MGNSEFTPKFLTFKGEAHDRRPGDRAGLDAGPLVRAASGARGLLGPGETVSTT